MRPRLVRGPCQVNALLKEIADARRVDASITTPRELTSVLTPWSKALLDSMPYFIRQQMLLKAQASDDKAQLNQIETERLLAELVRVELNQRRERRPNVPDAKYSPVCFYLGYQVCCLPPCPRPAPPFAFAPAALCFCPYPFS